jgi:hypothetical protein
MVLKIAMATGARVITAMASHHDYLKKKTVVIDR